MGSIRVAEHLKVKKFPAILGPEEKSDTWLVLNVVPNFTARMHGHGMEESITKKSMTL
jgi:hypothetical protein